MRATIIGTGYVGLVTGVSLAELGHQITFLDTDKERITSLQRSRLPIYEPGLAVALSEVEAAGRIWYTWKYEAGISQADFIFLCVGTPSDEHGDADLRQLAAALDAMMPHIAPATVIVIKSTVPVGTNRWVAQQIRTRLRPHAIVSNPEFLREGSALSDSRQPHRIVIGTRDSDTFQLLKRLYTGIGAPILHVTPEEAELMKYGANALLALKISFVNTLADLSEVFGADIRRVTEGMALDPRIGPHHLGAGLGFGGSCFPKDLLCLIRQCEQHGVPSVLLGETVRINQSRIDRVVKKLTARIGDLREKRVALLGLAFKAFCDDVRESQSLYLLAALLERDVRVQAYDPKATENAKALYPSAEYVATAVAACRGADAAVIATDWPEFQKLPWERILAAMRGNTVIDCRNQLDGARIALHGGRYVGMGVPSRGDEAT